LTKDGLRGARIGLLTDFLGHEAIHEPVNAVVEAGVKRMSAMGATVVRVSIFSLDALTKDLSLIQLRVQIRIQRLSRRSRRTRSSEEP
jgi:Asp-tRNA(Asn)/Glu-tRNA(Gln) amidotransferase A subunit family amidase